MLTNGFIYKSLDNDKSIVSKSRAKEFKLVYLII